LWGLTSRDQVARVDISRPDNAAPDQTEIYKFFLCCIADPILQITVRSRDVHPCYLVWLCPVSWCQFSRFQRSRSTVKAIRRDSQWDNPAAVADFYNLDNWG